MLDLQCRTPKAAGRNRFRQRSGHLLLDDDLASVARWALGVFRLRADSGAAPPSGW